MNPLITAEALKQLPTDSYILIDAGSGGTSRDHYLEKHLQGALYLDLNEDLAAVPQNPAQGGRHPLPPIERFKETLLNIGIEQGKHIIVYDDKNAANATARLWWMLRAVGLEKVQVLDGGLSAAERAGFPMVQGEEQPQKATQKLTATHWLLLTADLEEVKENYTQKDYTIIDVRSAERYQGKEEPIDLTAGHIPNALNMPFTENLNAEGQFQSPEVLRQHYEKVLKSPKQTVVHCGSGVTACHTILAMAAAGLPLPKLYVGSWSEWSRNDLPIATEEARF